MRYINDLQKFVDSYNLSPHRGLRNNSTPDEIHKLSTFKEITDQFNIMYKNRPSGKKVSFHELSLDNTARIVSSARQSYFNKSSRIQNTVEISKIYNICTKETPTTYFLKYLNGEIIEVIFYRE